MKPIRARSNMSTPSQPAGARTRACRWCGRRVAYKDDAGDAGVWGTRTDTPDSLQNIKYDSDRHAYDPRCEIEPDDLQYTKRMPSAFFETPLASYLTWHKVDTVVVTGGSTSGCVRATAVDALSATAIARSFRSRPAPTSMKAITSPT